MVITVRAAHQKLVGDDGFLTREACEDAAVEIAEVSAPLAHFLLARAQEMDWPVRVDDVMTSITQWLQRKDEA